jgi:hypothetical protein
MQANLNDAVHARLTDRGMDILKQYYESLGDEFHQLYTFDEFLKSKLDDQGRVRFQLWDFMSIFGQYLYLGAEPVTVDNRIDIVPSPVTLYVNGKEL